MIWAGNIAFSGKFEVIPAPRFPACRTVILLLLLGLALPALLVAKEATKLGRNATIVWLDEKGVRREVRGGEIRYGYFTRTLLSVPKDGKTFRDDEHQTNGLVFANSSLKFAKISRIEFRYEKLEDPEGTRLVLTVTPLHGKQFSESGNTLRGAAHPMSPFIAYRIDGAERRIELYPLGTEQDRGGRPVIVSADFKL